jgi:hypothetical protein
VSDVTVTLDADALRDVLSAAYAGKPHVYVDQERLTAALRHLQAAVNDADGEQ